MGLASTTTDPGSEGNVDAMTFSRNPHSNVNLSPGLMRRLPPSDATKFLGIVITTSCPLRLRVIVSPPPFPSGTVAAYFLTSGSNLGGSSTPGRGGAYAPLRDPNPEKLELETPILIKEENRTSRNQKTKVVEDLSTVAHAIGR